MKTKTDHRLVILDLNIKKPIFPVKQKQEPRTNLELLSDTEKSIEYKNQLDQKLENIVLTQTPQEKWDFIVTECHKTSKEVLGVKKKGKRSNNPEIKRLSDEQKELNIKINSNIDTTTRNETRKIRNRIQQEIRAKIKMEETQTILDAVTEIEETRDNSGKMYKAIRALQNIKPKQPLLIETDNGVTTNQEEQVKIITKFFKEFSNNPNMPETLNATPQAMNRPFTTEEIKSAIKNLKNNKSPGIDKLTAEQLKHGPDKIATIIDDILNSTAEQGIGPKELKRGILRPLQKWSTQIGQARLVWLGMYTG